MVLLNSLLKKKLKKFVDFVAERVELKNKENIEKLELSDFKEVIENVVWSLQIQYVLNASIKEYNRFLIM